LRGIGLAMFVEPSGGGAVPQEQAEIRFGESGEAVLYALSGPSGQGHETVYPALVAEVLGMPAERVTLKASDPRGPRLAGGGTVGSRSTMSHGSALTVAAREAVKKGLDLAARELEVSSADLHFEHGRYNVKGTDLAISFQEIAKRYGAALDAQGAVTLFTAFPGGAHVAEVEIDPHTGMVEVVAYVGVDDCGRVINHTLLEGQLHGGITQGIGQALLEHCVYDRTSAQLLTGSFMDYAMPRPGVLPQVRLYDHSVPSPGNPLGVKGVGEAGTVGAIPTVANAVIDALRPLGIHALDFPYSPLRIWQAIRAAHR
jgi:carbon-monoxide dehydrogenase large subunit